MDDPALRLRKLVGKVVLLLTGCWVIVLIACVAVVIQGQTRIPVFNWVTVLVPGCALVPGSYLSFRLLRAEDPALIKDLWVKPALYGASGLVLGIVTFAALVQIQGAS